MIWKFENLWSGHEWLSPAFIEVNNRGLIQSKPLAGQHQLSQTHSQTHPPVPIDEIDEEVRGWAVPGFQNAHSHAFQFAMAGLTEFLGKALSDDFWSWRQKMYQLALKLTPRQMESIATRLYSIMLTQGYTWVAEFHYLHHDPQGRAYGDISEMGQALLRAAEKTGIGITLIPIFYNQGGFGKAPEEEQKRFISPSIDDYLKLHSSTLRHCAGPRQKCALGIHSLRAIKPEHVKPLIKEAPQNQPWHIHIAEQKKEVSECLEMLGKTPVQWLMDHVNVDSNWHLVHGTHVSELEIISLQERQAHIVLCPSTEGNLGDGVFPLKAYWHGGGRWSIGSDSHIGLNPLEELRWLDYVQRLNHRQRNVLCRHPHENSGELLFSEALISGKRAMGLGWGLGCPVGGNVPSLQTDGVSFSPREPLAPKESLKCGEPFGPEKSLKCGEPLGLGESLDLVVIKPEATLWKSGSTQSLLSTLIYATSPGDFSGVIAGGKWVVQGGQHIKEGEFSKDWPHKDAVALYT